MVCLLSLSFDLFVARYIIACPVSTSKCTLRVIVYFGFLLFLRFLVTELIACLLLNLGLD